MTIHINGIRRDYPENLGIGLTKLPSSGLHVKANLPGVVGSNYAGQVIIQNPIDDVKAGVVITAYESDADGNPDEQLWYLGSASSGNEDITLLNRRAANLALGTNGIDRLILSSIGYVNIPGVYAETTLSAANIFVDTDGSLRRFTSSRKIKKDIIENVNPDWALQFKPVTCRAKADNSKHIGFIAEDMRSIDSRFASDGGKDNLPGLEMNAIVAALTATVKAQQKQINNLINNQK